MTRARMSSVSPTLHASKLAGPPVSTLQLPAKLDTDTGADITVWWPEDWELVIYHYWEGVPDPDRGGLRCAAPSRPNRLATGTHRLTAAEPKWAQPRSPHSSFPPT